MEGRYIYWLVINLIYLVIWFFVKKDKKYYCNNEIIWPLFYIVFLAGQNNASTEQISYYAGSILILIIIYFNALEIYKRLKEDKVKESKVNKYND